jgi:hypothetical protein
MNVSDQTRDFRGKCAFANRIHFYTCRLGHPGPDATRALFAANSKRQAFIGEGLDNLDDDTYRVSRVRPAESPTAALQFPLLLCGQISSSHSGFYPADVFSKGFHLAGRRSWLDSTSDQAVCSTFVFFLIF